MNKLIGEARLRAHLQRIRLEAEAAAPAAENAMAKVVAGRARVNAPKRTGAGAASIQAEGSKVIVGKGYMRFPDLGTVYIRAQHFLERATEAHKEIAAEAIQVFLEAIKYTRSSDKVQRCRHHLCTEHHRLDL